MEVVDFGFDKQQGKETRTNNLYEKLRIQKPKWKLGSVDYRTEQEFLPLQAADLIAWQNRRFLSIPREPVRIELKRLQEDRSRYLRKIISKKALYKMVDAKKTYPMSERRSGATGL